MITFKEDPEEEIIFESVNINRLDLKGVAFILRGFVLQ